MYQSLVRPALFRMDAEAAHDFTLKRLAKLGGLQKSLLKRRYGVSKPVTVFGVEFPNPVGLAAGMDKNGVALANWSALGFGFVEAGTVTALAQPGNDKPRLFRVPQRQAIVNRMGFNNAGAAVLAQRLLSTNVDIPVGISLGKSKVTPLEDAVQDYRTSFELLRDHGDYFAVNVSSPNTPGLRELQDKSHLDAILAALTGDKPILVKIAPDLTQQAIADLLEVCTQRGVAGLIATNTTIAHDWTDRTSGGSRERSPAAGGMSGAPLTERAREVVEFVHKETNGKLPIIGVGGIMTVDDAKRMFDAGASLIQLYTGFIYHGPALVRAIARSR